MIIVFICYTIELKTKYWSKYNEYDVIMNLHSWFIFTIDWLNTMGILSVVFKTLFLWRFYLNKNKGGIICKHFFFNFKRDGISLNDRCIKIMNKVMNIICYRMPNELPTLDFNDTFLNMDHLRSSFPGYEIKVQTNDPRKLVRPFR